MEDYAMSSDFDDGSSSISSGAAEEGSARIPRHPLFENVPRAEVTMRFIRISELRRLHAPIPRCQDLPPESFGVMRACDKLIAISHGWRFQMHPDPYGVEVGPLNELLDVIEEKYRDSSVELYAFLDYVAIPQRPFQPGQEERTEDEEDIFREALLHLEAVFRYADHLVHIDVPVELPPGEGETYEQHSVDGSSMELRQVGTHLQCVLPFPFDHLVEVNGEAVKTLADAERLLAQAGVADVTLVRHMYGLPNEVPCSDRGWIYLERFITMVVAAMVKAESFHDTVYANKGEVLQEIYAGAQRLRQAAQKDALFQNSVNGMPSFVGSGHYSNVSGIQSRESAVSRERSWGSRRPPAMCQAFTEFEERLIPKKFSAASVDKSLNPALRAVSTKVPLVGNLVTGSTSAGSRDSPPVEEDEMLLPPPSDAELVAEMMRTLVRHLAQHWEEEQEKRQARPLVVQKLESRVLVWDCLSPSYMQRIQQDMKFDPLLMAALALVPVFLVLSALLLPYTRPDAGLEANLVHVFLGFPWISMVCYMPIPRLAEVCMQADLPYRCTILWPLVTTLVTMIPVPTLATLFDVYPVPFAPITAAGTYLVCLPLMWLFISPGIRKRPRAREQFGWSILIQVATSTIFCVVYPVLNVWLQSRRELVEEILVALVFLGSRMLFESLVVQVSQRLGPDVYPVMVWIAEFFYQVALCDFFRSIQQWGMIFLFVGVDLLENFYYFYCFHATTRGQRRRQQRRGAASSSSSSDSVGRTSSAESAWSALSRLSSSSFKPPTRGPELLCDGISASVASVMLLRALADVLVPAQFLVILGVLQYSPTAQYSGWVADIPPSQLDRTLSYLVLSFSVELLFLVTSCCILHWRGMRPLQFLCGVITGGNAALFGTGAAAALMWYASLQLAHSGCDFQFRFVWLGGDATWIHGRQWEMVHS